MRRFVRTGALMLELREWYRGRRVFLTGHTGFKGAWLAVWLREAGARVTGYALPPEGADSLYDGARVADGIESVIGDIRDRGALDAALRRSRPEVVFHLAAQSLVRRSFADPVLTFDTNVTGTAILLDALRSVDSLRAVVVVTSDKCYVHGAQTRARREGDPLGGDDPYSASKGAQELVTAAYRRSFFARAGSPGIATARAGNVLGGGDWGEHRLVPDLMRAARVGLSATIRSPLAIRPWQHVMDVARGYLMLGLRLAEEPGEFGDSWNLGPAADTAVTVRDVARSFAARWPAVKPVEANPRGDHPPEEPVVSLDSTKAWTRLGWRPALSLDETIALTVDWYRAAIADPRASGRIVVEQWREYESRVAGSVRPEGLEPPTF